MTNSNILITGTKAGIGQGLLAAFAARPNTTVIAAIRDSPDSQKAKDMVLSITNVASSSKIIPVQYNASSSTAAFDTISNLRKTHPDVTHLDIVIANAGINTQWGKAHIVSAEDLTNHLNTNTLGPIFLYQATRNLLLASKGTPKFFVISTAVGSINLTKEIPFEHFAYGMSKVAVNWFTHKADIEEDRIVVIPVHPGWVDTAMGNDSAIRSGLQKAPQSLEDSVNGLMKLFDTATKEIGGTFQSADGRVLPW